MTTTLKPAPRPAAAALDALALKTMAFALRKLATPKLVFVPGGLR